MNNDKRGILPYSDTTIDRLARRRWATVAVAGVSLLGMVAAFAIAPPKDPAQLAVETVLEQLPAPSLTLLASEDSTFLREERVFASDTIASLLGRLGVSDQQALRFLVMDRSAQSLVTSRLQPGTVVTAKMTATGELLNLSFPLADKDSLIVVEKRGKNFVSTEQALELAKQTVIKSGEIRGSFVNAVEAIGIPESVATQLVALFGGDASFYRALRPGDRLAVSYEIFTYQGREMRSGRILAAEIGNRKRAMQAYWFEREPARGAYYTAEGKSLSRPFLSAPIDAPKITSGFSSARLHPILQTWRAHKGIDYAAPTGTKVLAVADGVVETAESQNGYGNMIVLRHDATYSTAYGHLSDYAVGLSKGTRVRQGDTIGYVGQTGLATDAHLHYEFRINDEQVDPQALDLPESVSLDRFQMSRFKTAKMALRTQLDLAKEMTLASIE